MDIEQICTLSEGLAECLVSLSAARYPATENGLLSFFNEHLHGILHSYQMEKDLTAALNAAMPGQMYEIRLRLGSTILIFPLPNNQFWIFGPCMAQPVTDDLLHTVLKCNRGLISNPATFTNHLRSLPQIPSGRLRWLGMLLAERIFPGRALEYIAIEDDAEDSTPQLVEEYEQILPMRMLEDRYSVSRVLTSAVTNGNFSLAYRAYQILWPSISQLQRSTTALRSAQNLAIILSTILRRAAEDGGVHPYALNRLSQEVNQKIESARSYEELVVYGEDVLRQYCSIVAELSFPNAGAVVRRAATYVQTNLSDNLTTRQMAKLLNLNPEYFSHRFSKETGSTFTDYVNRTRIRQAASLLKSTKLPIQEVAVASGYNSASYFIKKFHSVYGMTPTAYRQGEAETHKKE